MTQRATATFREEHEHLMAHVAHLAAAAAEVPELSIEERTQLVGRILSFLRDTLLPHAEAEERTLYPALATLYGHPDATATMSFDHQAIGERIVALETTAPEDTARLQQLLYGLHALISVHFRKEEEVYLPLLETRPDGEIEQLMTRMLD
jgi:iron-sulfur cluster repair protein YtfE (RIC family)